MAIATALLAVVSGLYLSSWTMLKLLGLASVPLQWNTWWLYFEVIDLPRFVPYATKIKLSGYVGFGLPLLAWLGLLVPLLRQRETTLHGEARFAAMRDLKMADMLVKKPESIVVGNYKGRHLYVNGAYHVIMVSPTRSGKTTCVAVPVLLTYEHSVVCLDVKGELLKLTSGQRAAMGQEIIVWAPFDEQACTHRFNPLALVSADWRQRVSDIQTLAAILYPDQSTQDPFWVAQSRGAFVAFASFMFERWDELSKQNLKLDPNTSPLFPSFERLLHFSTVDKAAVQQLLDDPRNDGTMSEQTRTGLAKLASLAEETFSSVIATMQAPLQPFLSPILAANTNGQDFDVQALRRRRMTIYCVIPPDKLGESSKLINIFFSTLIGQNLKVHPEADPTLKHQALFLMDEFTAMGPVDVIAERISVAAGFGVRFLTIIQSHAQLRATYGPDRARTFSTNHAVQIVFTPREQEDANDYSEMLGYRTLRRKHRSVTRGQGGSSVSHSVTEERRALMLPQEIKELPNDEQLIFVERCRPIRCRKNWYFKLKFFIKRVLPPAKVKAQRTVNESGVVVVHGEHAVRKLTGK
ncbi:MAG TPA: type IV secretory system conjugative DNA transfer family protein [Dyella sp.]|nr:type IV secretory system conjugative DNA transfer family protein [Dyella sp.]